MNPKPGVLYGVGIGPGDPELITLKALRTIQRCPVIAAPRTGGGQMLALEIADSAADLTGKLILPLDFTMAADPADREAAHEAAAAELRRHLDEGRDTALLTLGDVSLYATFSAVARRLASRGYETRMIPGVPSFCAAAARLSIPLAEGREPVHILPGGPPEAALALNGTKVLLKSGGGIAALRQALAESETPHTAGMVVRCGLPEERVITDLAAAEAPDYFTTIILKEAH